ncbi:hypothetical protein, partial [Thiolapillus sp.]|uniref:hypothetical protein n=2 Tax=Thiolapillus sp. TaxID=2017437 RepID=UPI003AF57FEE
KSVFALYGFRAHSRSKNCLQTLEHLNCQAITLPKKSNLQQSHNDRAISLISHPIKIMLKVILNRLNPKAEKTIAEE